MIRTRRLGMLGRRNKRARADSVEILEHAFPLPRVKPTPPQEYMVFQPTPALSKSQSQSQESPTAESSTAPGVKLDEKTRVGVSLHYCFCDH